LLSHAPLSVFQSFQLVIAQWFAGALERNLLGEMKEKPTSKVGNSSPKPIQPQTLLTWLFFKKKGKRGVFFADIICVSVVQEPLLQR
jgi:hypothetical protein